MSRRLPYLPALDGLRAVAVLLVICYHGELTWAKGGFLGVDLFFVISGALITTLLLREWRADGGIDLKGFWIRRARRLLPALFLVLGAIAVYAALMAKATELRTLRDDALASLGYVANWRFIFTGSSYFAQFNTPSPLRHLWSLAIEEQFYLLWPLIVYGLLRVRGGSVRLLAAVSTVMLVASVTMMWVLYEPGADPSRVYYGTDTRAQSLLVGALLAMIMIRHPVAKRQRSWIALQTASVVAFGGLIVIWGSIGERSDTLYRGGFLLEAVLAAVVIAAVTQPRSGPIGALLSIKPMRWIGMISYGLYLWHWPIFVVLNPDSTDLDGYALFALRVAVTFPVAIASYYLVERPVRRGAFERRTGAIVTAGVATTVAAAIVLVTIGAPAAQREVAASEVRAPTVSATRDPAEVEPTRVMLVGDSVANSLAPGLERRAATDGFVLWNATVPGCGLTTDAGERWIGVWTSPDARCSPSWRQRWPRDVREFDPDVVLLMVSGHDAVDRRFGAEIAFDSPEGAQTARDDLALAIRVLSSRGARVVVLTAPYFRRGWSVQVDEPRSSFNPAWVDRMNAIAREVTTALPERSSLADLNALLDPQGQFTEDVGGVRVRADDLIHLSDAGADMVAAWLGPQLVAPRDGESGPPTQPRSRTSP